MFVFNGLHAGQFGIGVKPLLDLIRARAVADAPIRNNQHIRVGLDQHFYISLAGLILQRVIQFDHIHRPVKERLPFQRQYAHLFGIAHVKVNIRLVLRNAA
ncbi:hypothetical protein D1872_284990 [compost metagenome]